MCDQSRSQTNGADTNSYRCDICGEMFPFARQYRSHVLTHSENLNLPFECSSDEESVLHSKCALNENGTTKLPSAPRSTRSRLRSLAEKAPPVVEPSVSVTNVGGSLEEYPGHDGDSGSNYKTHHCYICGKKYKYRRGLSSHLQIHSDKVHKCDMCERVYARKDVLSRHRREVHFNKGMKDKKLKKDFACALCGKRFALPSLLKRMKCSTRNGEILNVTVAIEHFIKREI